MEIGNIIEMGELKLMNVTINIIGKSVYMLNVNNLEIFVFNILTNGELECVSVSKFKDPGICLVYYNMITREHLSNENIDKAKEPNFLFELIVFIFLFMIVLILL